MSPDEVPQASELLPSPGEFHCAAVVGRCAAWLHLTGELDLATAPRLERELDRALNRARMVVLDLRVLEFIDVAGLRVILDASERAAEVGGRVVIMRGTERVHRVFELAGVSEHLVIFDAAIPPARREPESTDAPIARAGACGGSASSSGQGELSPESGSPTAPRDDEDLMRLICDGREDAFEELYDRYSARAYRVARSICEEQSRAELAVHDALVSVWRGGNAQRPRRGTVAAWLLTVVGDQAAGLARREQRHHGVETRAGGVEDLRPGGFRGALLAGLPDAQRDVIVLAYYGELALAEIADQLALAPAAVKKTMRMGLRGLLAQTGQPAG